MIRVKYQLRGVEGKQVMSVVEFTNQGECEKFLDNPEVCIIQIDRVDMEAEAKLAQMF